MDRLDRVIHVRVSEPVYRRLVELSGFRGVGGYVRRLIVDAIIKQEEKTIEGEL